MTTIPILQSAFRGPEDEFDGRGMRPVVFDILSPDREFSLLPAGLKMVLHTNPQTMSLSYAKLIERIQTKGGYVEQHWGRAAEEITFEMVTGGFMRLYTGLSSITGGGVMDVGGTRRETIAYDSYLDILALFHNNGSIYDLNGNTILQGILKVSFDGASYFGWFASFSVSEDVAKPYQFALSASFTIDHEQMSLRSIVSQSAPTESLGDGTRPDAPFAASAAGQAQRPQVGKIVGEAASSALGWVADNLAADVEE